MKKLPFIAVVVLSLIISVVVVLATNEEKLSNMSTYVFDSSGNFYAVQADDAGAKIIKVNKDKEVQYKKNIYSVHENNIYTKYADMDMNTDGDIICLSYDYTMQKDEDLNVKVGYLKEKLTLYNNNGEFIKDMAVIDWSNERVPPTTPYIIDFQVVGNRLDIFGCNGKTWEHRTIDTLELGAPKLIQTFKIESEPNSTGKADWICKSSLASTPDNRIAYVSKTGKFFVMDENKQFQDVTSKIGTSIFTEYVSADNSGNIYMLNTSTNYLISYNVQKQTVAQLFKPTSYLDTDRKISLCDIKSFYLVNDNKNIIFGAESKGEGQYILFGTQENQIYTVKYPFFYELFIKSLILTLALSVLGIIVIFLIRIIRSKTTITIKLYIMIIPIFIILTSLLGVGLFTGLSDSYEEVKLYSQGLVSTSLAEIIDGDSLETITASQYGSADYKKVTDDIQRKYDSLVTLSDAGSKHITIYTVRNGMIYSFAEFRSLYVEKFERSKVLNSIIMQEEQLSGGNRLYDILLQIKNNSAPVSMFNSNVAVYDRIYEDSEALWIATVSPIRNSAGTIVGLIENVQDEETMFEFTNYMSNLLVFGVILINIIIMLALFFILKAVFKPLKKLQRNISNIGDNNWEIKLEVTTHDEIGDLTTAFNFMSDRINRYVSSIVSLNRICLRFLPKDIFQLMGKQRIIDVSLYDKMERTCHFILVEFPYEKMEEKNQSDVYNQYFNKMNVNFNTLYKIVDRNNGIINTYDGRGMLVVIPGEARDALNAALQLKDFFQSNNRYQGNVNIVLGTADMLIGVSGNESKCSVSILSETLNSSYYISGQIEKLGISFVMTESIVEKLKDNSNFQCRYLGRIKRTTIEKIIPVYELINSIDIHEKNLYLQTKKIFEFGVNSYIEADFYSARRAFSNVLSINEEDTVAMYYLGLCNQNENKSPTDWEGLLF